MKFTLSDGLQLYYEYKGNPTAKYCLVFLSGLTQTTLVWGGMVQALEKDFQILLIDLIHQGQSDTSNQERLFENHAQDVVELIHFLNINHPIWVGISYGGAVTLRLLAEYPNLGVAGLVISSFAHTTPHFRAMGESWKLALDAGGYALFSDVLLPWALSPTYYEYPIIPIETLKMLRSMSPIAPERLYRLMIATDKSGDYRPKLVNISVPVYVLVGSLDITTPPALNQEIAKHITGAHYTELAHKGHTLNIEAIPEILTTIQNLAQNLS